MFVKNYEFWVVNQFKRRQCRPLRHSMTAESGEGILALDGSQGYHPISSKQTLVSADHWKCKLLLGCRFLGRHARCLSWAQRCLASEKPALSAPSTLCRELPGRDDIGGSKSSLEDGKLVDFSNVVLETIGIACFLLRSSGK